MPMRIPRREVPRSPSVESCTHTSRVTLSIPV
jgi:hypothetical protein